MHGETLKFTRNTSKMLLTRGKGHNVMK